MTTDEARELDSLFVLRHAQRCDKIASTISSIDFVRTPNEYTITDSYNPGLATFQSTNNKSNNGYIQSLEMGSKLLTYIEDHVKEPTVVLKFHTSPYLRCVQTVKFMIDYLVKRHRQEKLIKVVISIDQVLSEWLNTELDMNYYPPNDNGATLLGVAVQYLNSNLQFNRNENVKIEVNLKDSYRYGNPGPYSESFIQHHSRITQGLISIVKDEAKNLSPEPDSKDIVLVMTHGAAVRSLISKLIGKSLYVEIPLSSMSIAKPIAIEGKRYFWKLLETDVELQNRFTFQQVDLYSTRDQFQGYQTTFSTNSQTSQLNFRGPIPASKTDNFNRIRSQSLLNPRNRNDSDDSEDDSDNEGLTFKVTRSSRQSFSNHSEDEDQPKRYRSSSLFGPVLNNPFWSDSESRSSRSKKNSFEKRQRSFVRREEEIISPIQNISKSSSSFLTPTITPTVSHTQYSYQNLDPNDGVHDISNEKVPDLAEISSNNSSTNSLHEDLTIFPGTLSKLSPPTDTTTILNDFNEPPTVPETSYEDELLSAKPSNTSMDPYNVSKASSSSFIFNRSAIEESLNEIIGKEPVDETPPNNWLAFGASSGLKSNNDVLNTTDKPKFTIDLYGKKNRHKTLDLYGDSEESSSGGGWFLGSNKY